LSYGGNGGNVSYSKIFEGLDFQWLQGLIKAPEIDRKPHVPTPKRTEKLQIMLDDEELKVIDDWRFDHRMPTRAAAIRELIRRGLIAEDVEEPETEGKSTTDFRVEPE
tara:strand:- start:166 stop:489 length:324 start_codon:yes stop_codon:yes gene_type:complete